MKIGELFIALGFKVEGRDKFDEAEKGLVGAAVKASALALAVNAVNYAFLQMIKSGTEAATAFMMFETQTDLSARRLQGWQAAAERNNVSGKELLETVKAIQMESARISFGEGNIRPFAAFGIAADQDPFAILDQVRQRIKTLRPEVARMFASEMHIGDNVFSFLRNAGGDIDRVEQSIRMTREEQAGLVALARVWRELSFAISSVRDKFSSTFAPALLVVLGVVRALTSAVGSFVNWLGKGSAAAGVLRFGLVALAAAFGILGVVLAAVAAVAAALGAAALGTAALTLAAAPAIVTVAAFAGGILVLLGALVALVLLLDDFWTQVEGGKSAFDWNDNLILTVKNVERLAAVMERLLGVYDKIKSAGRALFFEDNAGLARYIAETMSKTGGSGGSSTQNNNVRVMVDGSRSADETARAVGRELADVISDASYQLPIPSR